MNSETRTEMLKGYLERLQNGEDLNRVQDAFRQNFSDVSANEIVKAEQALIRSGTPLKEVQRLCDLHSALFHGETKKERIAAAEKAMQASMKEENRKQMQKMPSSSLASAEGHPIMILTEENSELLKRIHVLEELMNQKRDQNQLYQSLMDLNQVQIHYDKKDELILPPLKRHGIPGPADVMWNADGEIRTELKRLIKETDLPAHMDEIQALCERMKEMRFKEEKILFPLAEKKFTAEEWQDIYADLSRFGYAWLDEVPVWKQAVKKQICPGMENGRILLSTGQITVKELEGILNTIPLELTFINAKDENAYFSKEGNLFPRALSALGHQVYECHPSKAVPMVRNVISQLRSGDKNEISFITAKKGRNVFVRYLAVKDEEGNYLGTLEAVEDITVWKGGQA